jgi:NAD-dependent deacetylase
MLETVSSTVRSIVILTGAGISADSGLATFRGAGGLWEGARVEDVATPQAWRRDPALVWRFYQERRARLAQVEPNAAHRALAELERAGVERDRKVQIFTQNVDDLHERAGSQPFHVHGELAVLRCEGCGARLRDLERVDPAVFLPCPACAAERLRPDVVWFGEIPYFQEEVEAALMECDLFLAVGTSGAVWPAAGWLAVARARGARTIVQALDEPENLSRQDEFRAGRASEIVPALVRELVGDLVGSASALGPGSRAGAGDPIR